MEDHVIVDKKKYDDVLAENVYLKEKLSKNVVLIQLSSDYGRYQRFPTYYEYFIYGEHVPKEAKDYIDGFKLQIDNSIKQFEDYKNNVNKALEENKNILDQQKELRKEARKELNDKIEQIPSFLRKWFKIKKIEKDDKRIN